MPERVTRRSYLPKARDIWTVTVTAPDGEAYTGHAWVIWPYGPRVAHMVSYTAETLVRHAIAPEMYEERPIEEMP